MEKYQQNLDETFQYIEYYTTCIVNLKEKYETFRSQYFDAEYIYIDDDFLEKGTLRFLHNPKVDQRLGAILGQLKSITLKAIETALPQQKGWNDGNYYPDIHTAQIIFKGKKETEKYIAGIIKRRSERNGVPKLFFKDFSRTQISTFKKYLIDEKMIDNVSNFRSILKGEAINEKINWTSSLNHFVYFIKELSKRQGERRANWKAAEDLFTINNEIIIASKIKGNNGKIPSEIKEIIDQALNLLFF